MKMSSLFHPSDRFNDGENNAGSNLTGGWLVFRFTLEVMIKKGNV